MRQLLSKRKVYGKVIFLYGLFTVVGLISDSLLSALLVLSIALLLSHYHHLFLLDKWLWRDRKMTPPAASGAWQPVFEGIYYLQRKERRKRKALRKLIRRYHDGAEALPEGVVVLGQNWEIVWSNKLAQQFLGLHWPTDEGQRIDNLIRAPEFQHYLQQKSFQQSLEIRSPVNEEQFLELKLIIYGEQYLLLVQDITQLKQLEQIRKDFVANVSHELRTPLTVLHGYLEMLEGSQLPDAALWQKSHAVMLDQTRRMDSLIQQLLALSRIEASGKTLLDEIVDVPAMLKQLEQEVQTLNRDKQHKIRFQIEPDLKVPGIAEELRSVFVNLVTNAIKYTPAGGKIDIIWQRHTDRTAIFSVIDNGNGIAAQHVKRLTERFYRVDPARNRSTGGTGLGLAIVKHILSRHNSSLDIDSKLNHGSCFSFVLAAAKDKSQTVAANVNTL